MPTPHFTVRQQRWATRIGLALGVALLVVVLTQENILQLGIVERLELASLDYRFQFRKTPEHLHATSDVVIVEISGESFRSVPDKWPWPRSYYARLIRNLHKAGARAVGIDVILGGSDVHSPSNDQELRDAILQTRIVVLAGKAEPLEETHSRVTHSENYGNMFFDTDSSLGVVNIYNDADGVYRRYSPLFGTNSGLLVPSFSFAVLNKAWGFPALTTVENSTHEFNFAGVAIPKYDPKNFLINFSGPSDTFRRVKFVDVIDDDSFTTLEEADAQSEINTFSDPEFGYLYDGTFKDRIVLVGSTVPEDHDLFPVSIARGIESGDNLMYGVEIHANVIESILRREFLRKQTVTTEITVVLLLTALTFVVTSRLKGSRSRHHVLVEVNAVLFVLAEISLLGFIAVTLFTSYGYVIAVISPTLGVVSGYVASTTYHFVVERKQRMLIKTMFSTYVNPGVVEELLNNPEKLKLGGERKELTVMFSDVEGFTTFSERMSPEDLVAILNEYLSMMSAIIFQHHGTLDKYEGDAIMAFWGAPIHQDDHALRASLTALRMQESTATLRADWLRRGKPEIKIRIGLNTGEMVVGNMGGLGKFDYTVIGDSVNLASRLEGANKSYGTGIMASERTYELVKHRIIGRELDIISVVGRSEAIHTYELLQERTPNTPPQLIEFLNIYENALQLFRNRQWSKSRDAFTEALRRRPHDQPCTLYIERASRFEKHPPDKNWTGVSVLTIK